MNLIKSLVLSLLLVLFTAADVSAQNCVAAPDCAAMGYTKSEADCEGKHILRCFYDTSKVFCGGESISCDPTVSCAHCAEMCNGNCVRCDACTYTKTSKPSNCTTAASCTFEGTTYYSDSCTTCTSPYIKNGSDQCVCPDTKDCTHCIQYCNGNCVKCSSCIYTETAKPNNCHTATASCLFGTTTYYAPRCAKCNSPYIVDSNKQCVCPDTVPCNTERCLDYCEGNCVSCCSEENWCPHCQACHGDCCADYVAEVTCNTSEGFIPTPCAQNGSLYKCTLDNATYCEANEFSKTTSSCSDVEELTSCPKDSSYKKCVYSTQKACAAEGYDQTSCSTSKYSVLCPRDTSGTYMKCMYNTEYCQYKEYTRYSCDNTEDAEQCPEYPDLHKCTLNPAKQACVDAGYTYTSCTSGRYPKECPSYSGLFACYKTSEYCKDKGYNKYSCDVAEDAEACPEHTPLLKCTENPDKVTCINAGYTYTSCSSVHYPKECPNYSGLFYCQSSNEKCEEEGYTETASSCLDNGYDYSIKCPYALSYKCHNHDITCPSDYSYDKYGYDEYYLRTCSGNTTSLDTMTCPTCGEIICKKVPDRWQKGKERMIVVEEDYECRDTSGWTVYPKAKTVCVINDIEYEDNIYWQDVGDNNPTSGNCVVGYRLMMTSGRNYSFASEEECLAAINDPNSANLPKIGDYDDTSFFSDCWLMN